MNGNDAHIQKSLKFRTKYPQQFAPMITLIANTEVNEIYAKKKISSCIIYEKLNQGQNHAISLLSSVDSLNTA